jgi:hypothetical protein
MSLRGLGGPATPGVHPQRSQELRLAARVHARRSRRCPRCCDREGDRGFWRAPHRQKCHRCGLQTFRPLPHQAGHLSRPIADASGCTSGGAWRALRLPPRAETDSLWEGPECVQKPNSVREREISFTALFVQRQPLERLGGEYILQIFF